MSFIHVALSTLPLQGNKVGMIKWILPHLLFSPNCSHLCSAIMQGKWESISSLNIPFTFFYLPLSHTKSSFYSVQFRQQFTLSELLVHVAAIMAPGKLKNSKPWSLWSASIVRSCRLNQRKSHRCRQNGKTQSVGIARKKEKGQIKMSRRGNLKLNLIFRAPHATLWAPTAQTKCMFPCMYP